MKNVEVIGFKLFIVSGFWIYRFCNGSEKMKRRKIWIILLAIVLTLTLINVFNNLKTEIVLTLDKTEIKINFRKSEEKIQENLLKVTPLGTSMEDVLRVIEINKKWELVWISTEYPHNDTNLHADYIIGDKSIKAYIGNFGIIFETSVEAYWGFDENDKLIEIGIRKTTNTL